MIYCGEKLGFSGCSFLGWYLLAKVLTNLSWFCLGRFADGPAFSARFDATKVTALHYIIIVIAHRQTCGFLELTKTWSSLIIDLVSMLVAFWTLVVHTIHVQGIEWKFSATFNMAQWPLAWMCSAHKHVAIPQVRKLQKVKRLKSLDHWSLFPFCCFSLAM